MQWIVTTCSGNLILSTKFHSGETVTLSHDILLHGVIFPQYGATWRHYPTNGVLVASKGVSW